MEDTNVTLTWGQYMRQLRHDQGHSGRSFCRQHDLDVSMLCRHETGMHVPTDDYLDRYAKALRLARGSDQWRLFMDLATDARKPEQLQNHTHGLAPVLALIIRSAGCSRTEFDLAVDAAWNSEDHTCATPPERHD